MPNYRRYFQNANQVFITIVTYNRLPILISNIDILRQSFQQVKYEYNLIAGVVLPDHLHFIIRCENSGCIPKIISSVKSNFSREMPFNNYQSEKQILRREKGIWQRKYFDHIIRDEDDLHKHLDYIHYNPIKHGYVQKVRDWEYSSFEKFVEKGYYDCDWCNFEDKNGIKFLNLE